MQSSVIQFSQKLARKAYLLDRSICLSISPSLFLPVLSLPAILKRNLRSCYTTCIYAILYFFPLACSHTSICYMLGDSVLSKTAEVSAPTELTALSRLLPQASACLSASLTSVHLPRGFLLGDPASHEPASLCPQPAVYGPGSKAWHFFIPVLASLPSPFPLPCHLPGQWRAVSPSFGTSSKTVFCPGTTYLLGTVPRAHNIIKDSQKCFSFF